MRGHLKRAGDRRSAALGRLDKGLCLLVGTSFAAYAGLSIERHETFRSTGFDLALFEQVTRHYSRLETPASAIKGLGSILQDHMSPIMALLGPLYSIWPATAALLVAQAALIALSAVPVFLYAEPRLGRGSALMLATAYLLSGGVQEAVWFDVHEFAFAPLLIGLVIVLADRGRWGWSFAAAVALLSVKEDMAFLVMAIGCWYAIKGRRALGLLTAAAGLGWYLLATDVLMSSYTYWSYGELGADVPEAARTALTAPWRVLEVATSDVPKIRTTAYLFGAFFGLSLLSPLAILTLPLLAERMLSTNPVYWTLENHYSLTIAPVLALAAADGLRRLATHHPRRVPQVAAAMVALALGLTAAFPLGELLHPSFYAAPAAYRSAGDAVAAVPHDAAVAATNRLAPHFDGRSNLTLFEPRTAAADYVVADLRDTTPEGLFPFRTARALAATVAAERARRPIVFDRDGVVVLGPRR